MSANSGPMHEPPNDPDAFQRALNEFRKVLALPSVGASRHAEIVEMAALIGKHREEARRILAELDDKPGPPEVPAPFPERD